MSVVTHLNPPSLPASPAFSQAVKVAAPATLVFIGGQNGVDTSGQLVSDQADEQCAQALRNVESAVQAAGGTIADIVKWTITVTDRAVIGPGFGAFQQLWGQRPNPPAISVQIVTGLGNPDFLVEIEAVAALSD